MKQFTIILAFITTSLFSFSQDKVFNIYSISEKPLDVKRGFVGNITISPKTITIVELGKTVTFDVISTKPYFGSTLYKVKPVNDVDESEFYVNEEENVVERTDKINRLSGDGLIKTISYYYSKSTNGKVSQSIDNDGKLSIGTMGGFGVALSSDYNNSTAYNYGGYIDFGSIGVEILTGAGLTNNNPTSYINGKSNNYVSGFTVNNYGLLYNFKPTPTGGFYIGAGLQTINEIATNNAKSNSSPYGIVGLKGYYGDSYEIRAEINLGMVSTANIGFGVRF